MNILIVSPYFPPDKGIGTLRMESLAKYLLKQGCEVTVLTNAKSCDSSSLLPEFKYSFVNVPAEDLGYMREFIELQQLYKAAFEKLTDSKSFDAAVISGGPFYSFDVALADENRLPCVLDFRDPWCFDYRPDKNFFNIKTLLCRMLEIPMERRAVKAAAAVVTVTEGWKNKFRRLYHRQRDKFYTIANGYNDEVLDSITFPDKTEEHGFTVGAFGKLFYYTEKYSRVFLSALHGMKDDIEILQVGEKEAEADRLLDESGLPENLLKSTGFLQYDEGIKELSRSDFFLIIDERKSAMGTKLYDYIYLNKPIVYVGPADTAIARTVSGFENGFACSSAEEVIQAIADIRKNHTVALTEKSIKADYSRSGQNKKYYALLKSLAENFRAL
ncbi:MAG: glycosyltransferase [Candidatus Limivicinus sp.]|jgi:glycosyltransferase involved in cell wall biosynthesis